MHSSLLTGETTTPQTPTKVGPAASTPPAAARQTPKEDPTNADMLGLKPRKSIAVPDIKSSPLEGDLIAPFVDLSNCTRAEIAFDSVAATAILVHGVEDFTERNFDAKSRRVKPKRPKYESDSENESDYSSSEEDDDYQLTHLQLGMGIHETEFKGEKVFLELRFMKDGPNTLMGPHGDLVHNKLMAVYVNGVGRGEFIQEFLEMMIKRLPVPDRPVRRRTEFEIYRWNHCREEWRHTQSQKARALDSVILPRGLIEKIMGDMREFLSPETAEWYDAFGIPYKRSYLFHGVPGSGKTSLITALAGKLRRNVCFLNAHHPQFSDDIMKRAMERLPRRAFLIMEDIDSLFNQRTSMNRRSPLTFTGLLNCLDGIGHACGQIVIMTTNYIDRLDEALIRAGRADMWVEFKFATKWQLGEVFKWFYHKTPEEAEKWKDTFVENCTAKFPEGVTIAEMQQHFVDTRKKTAKECAESVANYDMPARKFTIGDKAKAKKEYLNEKNESGEENSSPDRKKTPSSDGEDSSWEDSSSHGNRFCSSEDSSSDGSSDEEETRSPDRAKTRNSDQETSKKPDRDIVKPREDTNKCALTTVASMSMALAVFTLGYVSMLKLGSGDL